MCMYPGVPGISDPKVGTAVWETVGPVCCLSQLYLALQNLPEPTIIQQPLNEPRACMTGESQVDAVVWTFRAKA
eukprot:358796-Chlamydomonas_euryale.AAC.17